MATATGARRHRENHLAHGGGLGRSLYARHCSHELSATGRSPRPHRNLHHHRDHHGDAGSRGPWFPAARKRVCARARVHRNSDGLGSSHHCNRMRRLRAGLAVRLRGAGGIHERSDNDIRCIRRGRNSCRSVAELSLRAGASSGNEVGRGFRRVGGRLRTDARSDRDGVIGRAALHYHCCRGAHRIHALGPGIRRRQSFCGFQHLRHDFRSAQLAWVLRLWPARIHRRSSRHAPDRRLARTPRFCPECLWTAASAIRYAQSLVMRVLLRRPSWRCP